MPFPLSHWSRPRATIACRHKDDDFAYALHGAQMAALAVQKLDRLPSVLSGLTCVDYGCGTGRISRVLASYFKSVVGYDPNPECIDEAGQECPGIQIDNLKFTNDLAAVPRCNVAVSVNVLEHLDDKDAQIAIDAMLDHASVAVVWYSMERNKRVMAPHLTPEQIEQDSALAAAGGTISIALIRASGR